MVTDRQPINWDVGRSVIKRFVVTQIPRHLFQYSTIKNSVCVCACGRNRDYGYNIEHFIMERESASNSTNYALIIVFSLDLNIATGSSPISICHLV